MSNKGPLPPGYFFYFLVALVALGWLLPIYRYLSWPYTAAGLVPLIVGGWITVWADQIFKKRGTAVKPYDDASVLVVNGPFRISRHPMYLGMTLVLLGVALFTGSLSALAPVVGFALIMQYRFIPAEEAAMGRIFGGDYADYCGRVRKWI